ncbi:MAG: cytochrome P450 [Gammaproteobacteria bacterium]|nr:cytochrome P450 [Gammaproteobacteria bacterium]
MPAIEFDPTKREVQQNPYPRYQQLRDHAPVYRIESLNAYALTRYDDCKNTFLHPELYSAKDFITQAFGDLDPVPEVPSLIAMDPPAHTPLRKLAGQGFLPSVTRGVEPKIHSIVNGLLDEIEARGREFDFVGDFAGFVPVSVTAELIGVDRSQRENFKIWTSDLLNAANRASLSEADVSRIRGSVAQLRAYLEGVIAERTRAPTDDFISQLVKAEIDGDMLSTIQVLSVAILTHFGGSETPSHLISSALLALFENPTAHEEVRGNPSLTTELVEETLRYWSPVNLVFQTATQGIELHDCVIPGGAYVMSYISSANRDERRFEDPDRFDLHRDAHGHLSFAHGPHYCPGAALGKRMAAIAIGAVLARMPNLQRLEPTTEWLPSLWVRGAKTLRVAF